MTEKWPKVGVPVGVERLGKLFYQGTLYIFLTNWLKSSYIPLIYIVTSPNPSWIDEKSKGTFTIVKSLPAVGRKKFGLNVVPEKRPCSYIPLC